MELPFPSGMEITFQESDDIDNTLDFFKKYRDIISIDRNYIFNKETKEYEPSKDSVSVRLNLKTVENIQLFKQLLNDVQILTKPSLLALQRFAYRLMKDQLVQFEFKNPNQVIDIFNKLKQLVDKHNLYLDHVPESKLERIVNNYITYNEQKVALDPVNLIQAQTPVDSTTGPLKDIAEESS